MEEKGGLKMIIKRLYKLVQVIAYIALLISVPMIVIPLTLIYLVVKNYKKSSSITAIKDKSNLKTSFKTSIENIKEAKKYMDNYKIQQANQPVHCPKCFSTQITANKNGFSAKKAIAGTLVIPIIGLFAGCHGKNKVNITCLKCGHTWTPG